MTEHCQACGKPAAGSFLMIDAPNQMLCSVCARKTPGAVLDYAVEGASTKSKRPPAATVYHAIYRQAVSVCYWHYDGSRLRYCPKRQTHEDTTPQFWRSDGDDMLARVVHKASVDYPDYKPSDLFREVKRLLTGAPDDDVTTGAWPPRQPQPWSIRFRDVILDLAEPPNCYLQTDSYDKLYCRPYEARDYVEEGHTLPVDMPVMDILTEFQDVTLAEYVFKSVFLDPDYTYLLYQVTALCMLMSYNVEKFVVCYGDGNNGKTALLSLLIKMLGQNNVSAGTLQTLSTRFGSSVLLGKFANIGDEFPPDALQSVETIKQLTGGSYMQAEAKYEKPQAFRNTAFLVFAGNQIPMIESETEGFWRRVILVHFPKIFGTPAYPAIPDLKQKIDALKPDDLDIQWLAAVGVREALRLRCGAKLAVDQSVPEVAEAWRRAANPVIQYIDEHCEYDPGGMVTSSRLLNEINRYQAERYQNRRPRITPRQFARYMDAEGYTKTRSTAFGGEIAAGAVCWQGLRFKSDKQDSAF